MTAKELIRKNLNVPNVLTMIRLLLVPVYVVLFVSGQKYAALVTFLAASLTDLLDGRIARKYNLITDFGKLVDPFADKVMVLTALLSMAIGSSAIRAGHGCARPAKRCFRSWAKKRRFCSGGWCAVRALRSR